MTTCTATTADSRPCKNPDVKGTELCRAHGGADFSIAYGAPPGNTDTIQQDI